MNTCIVQENLYQPAGLFLRHNVYFFVLCLCVFARVCVCMWGGGFALIFSLCFTSFCFVSDIYIHFSCSSASRQMELAELQALKLQHALRSICLSVSFAEALCRECTHASALFEIRNVALK